MPNVAEAMRSHFNLRSRQPSKGACYIIPQMFPFTGTTQRYPATRLQGSLLDSMERAEFSAPCYVHQRLRRVLAGRRRAETHRPGDLDRRGRILTGSPVPLRRLLARPGRGSYAGSPNQ